MSNITHPETKKLEALEESGNLDDFVRGVSEAFSKVKNSYDYGKLEMPDHYNAFIEPLETLKEYIENGYKDPENLKDGEPNAKVAFGELLSAIEGIKLKYAQAEVLKGKGYAPPVLHDFNKSLKSIIEKFSEQLNPKSQETSLSK
jgi:hypothetical protein